MLLYRDYIYLYRKRILLILYIFHECVKKYFSHVYFKNTNFSAPPFSIINALAELGYRVISSTGDSEVLWTMQRELGILL